MLSNREKVRLENEIIKMSLIYMISLW
jgi:hypothetical protein